MLSLVIYSFMSILYYIKKWLIHVCFMSCSRRNIWDLRSSHQSVGPSQLQSDSIIDVALRLESIGFENIDFCMTCWQSKTRLSGLRSNPERLSREQTALSLFKMGNVNMTDNLQFCVCLPYERNTRCLFTWLGFVCQQLSTEISTSELS